MRRELTGEDAIRVARAVLRGLEVDPDDGDFIRTVTAAGVTVGFVLGRSGADIQERVLRELHAES